jgi:HSP20 family protein
MANLPSLWRGSELTRGRDPFRAMARMQREMDKMYENFWGGSMSMGFPEIPEAIFQPPYKVDDKDSHFLFTFDVPGLSKDDIKVEILDNQLHVYGDRSQEREEKKSGRFESQSFSFDQWFTLPPGTKPEAIEARVENGILQIAVQKTEASKAKEIKVGEGKTGFFSKLLEKKEKAA